MAQGHSNAYIADHFVLSLKTVRNHVSNILAKLGTSTRAEAVVTAHQAGLGGHTDRPGSSG
jgi:DNA-binding NarL/FixJ family response regulator